MQYTPLPGSTEYDLSMRDRADSFYKPPLIVESFIQHVNKQRTFARVAKLWSIPRMVVIEGQTGRHLDIPYELIEDDIVNCLDLVESAYGPDPSITPTSPTSASSPASVTAPHGARRLWRSRDAQN